MAGGLIGIKEYCPYPNEDWKESCASGKCHWADFTDMLNGECPACRICWMLNNGLVYG